MGLFGKSKKEKEFEKIVASFIADDKGAAKPAGITPEKTKQAQATHTEVGTAVKEQTHITYEGNTAEFTEMPQENAFAVLQEKAAKMFSVESLTEKTDNKHFAEAFHALISLSDKNSIEEYHKAAERLKKASGNACSGKADKYPYLLLGHALNELYKADDGYWMIIRLEEVVKRKINVDLFFALPAVIKKIKYLAEHNNENHIALLAILTIQEYGLNFDKENLLLLADDLEAALKKHGYGRYRMKITPERLRDIANGLYDGVLDSIRSFRALALSAEAAGNTEEAVGYYFEAAKLADFASIRDYLRLATDLNQDIAFTFYKSKDSKLFYNCWKAAEKKNNISEKIAALQPAMDIFYPKAFTVASMFYENAGDAEKASEMHEKALCLADTDAINKDFQFDDAVLFAHDTDRYMRLAFLQIAEIVRKEGKLANGFEITINYFQIDKFFDMMMKLCAVPDFFEEKAEAVPQLDDRQKQIVFAWVFRVTFDNRFDGFGSIVLANLFDTGFGTPVNKKAAIQIWTKNVVKDRNGVYPYTSCDAAYFIGRAYLLGDGVDRDKEKAVEYLNIAILSDYGSYRTQANKLLELSEKSPTELSNEGVACYRKGEYEKALGYVETAALLGSAIGCRNAGICYENGQGTEKNMDKANAYYRMGANGDIQCAFYAGEDREKNGDYASAKVYFENSATMKDVNGKDKARGFASLHLAEGYYNGNYTGKKDTVHYTYWIEKAVGFGAVLTEKQQICKSETKISSYELLMEFNSIRQKQLSDDYSVFVLEKAVEAEIMGAQEELGIRYYTGLGVAADKNKAFTLLTRAQKETHTERCDYYLACWYTDKAVEFYFDSDLQGLYDSINKASQLIIETSRSLDSENKRDLIHALYEYISFELSISGDEEPEENEIEERFQRTVTLLDAVKTRYPEVSTAITFDINMDSFNYCRYLDDDEKESRIKNAYRYLCKGINAGIERCKKKYSKTPNESIIPIAQLFVPDEPEIALFYLERTNETDPEAMNFSGSIHKLVYKDYKKALYYFDKALRAGSDDNDIQREIGFPFDENRNAVSNPYGLSTSQQVMYLKMSAANGCDSAKKILSIYRENGFI